MAQIAMTESFLTAHYDGASTAWAPMPAGVGMTVTFTVESGESVLLMATISRLWHSRDQRNTQLRIVVDGDGSNPVAIMSTGQISSYYTKAPSLHGVKSGLAAGTHTAQLQYMVRAFHCAP